MAVSRPPSPYSPRDIDLMAQQLLNLGMHPSAVRVRLAEKGLHWGYGYERHQALRQRLRQLRKQGLGLCSECKMKPYVLATAVNVCPDCLEAKWATSPSIRRNGHGSPEHEL